MAPLTTATVLASPAHLRDVALSYERRSKWCGELAHSLSSIPTPPMPAWVAVEAHWRLTQTNASLREIERRLHDDSRALEHTAYLFEEADRRLSLRATDNALKSALAVLDDHSVLGSVVTGIPVDLKLLSTMLASAAELVLKVLSTMLASAAELAAASVDESPVRRAATESKHIEGAPPYPLGMSGEQIKKLANPQTDAERTSARTRIRAIGIEASKGKAQPADPQKGDKGQECIVYAQSRVHSGFGGGVGGVGAQARGNNDPEHVLGADGQSNVGPFNLLFEENDHTKPRRPIMSTAEGLQGDVHRVVAVWKMSDFRSLQQDDYIIWDREAGAGANPIHGHIAVVEVVGPDFLVISDTNWDTKHALSPDWRVITREQVHEGMYARLQPRP